LKQGSAVTSELVLGGFLFTPGKNVTARRDRGRGLFQAAEKRPGLEIPWSGLGQALEELQLGTLRGNSCQKSYDLARSFGGDEDSSEK